jgi:DNA-binding SARP family transcriptional activator/pimeloyl-ACP methyl ester carboxylesterase
MIGMAGARLQLFGGFRLEAGSGRAVTLATKKAKALLAYLALHPGQPQSRAKLAALLWQDSGEAQARESLRQTLTQLRKALAPEHAEILAVEGDAIGLKTGAVGIDVLDFERLVALDAPQAMEQASTLYRGDLLDGFHLRAAEFEEWMLAERQRLRECALDRLNRLLANHLASGEAERGITVANRLLALDPLQEAVHRALMELYCRQGRHASALRQYRICAETLARELGVEPDAATKALQAQVIEARNRLRTPPAPPPPPRESAIAGIAPHGARRYATVLCAAFDIDAALSLVDDPEEIRETLAPLLATISAMARGHGGTVTAMTDSAITLVFGAPIAAENHALRAVLAALEIEAGLGRRATGGADLQSMLHLGIDSGEVVLRGEGMAPREAFGLPIKLAARLAEHLALGGIILTARSAALVQHAFSLVAIADAAMLTEAAPLPLFRVTGRLQAAGRNRLRRHFVPFIGRKVYLDTLQRPLGRGRAHAGEAIALVGDAGIGKSRLIAEFASIARAQGWQVLETGGAPEGARIALFPLIELLKSYFGIADEDTVDAARGKLVRRLLALDPALRPAIPPLLALLSLPPEEDAWDGLGAAQRTRRMHTAIRSLLLREAERQPLVLVVEDLHWLDDESLAVMDALVDSAADAALFIVASCRPEFSDRWSQRAHVRRLYLHPFQAATAETFITILLGSDPSLAAIKRELAQRCAGNPFFLEATVRMLAEQGVLAGEPGGYRLAAAPAPLGIPDTVRAVLAARIDRLPAPQKLLVQLASVIGLNVPHSLLAAVAPWSEEDLLQHFAGVQAAGLMYESRLLPDAQYSFRHVLTQEVAYRGLLREDRRSIHLHVAQAIETCFADRLGEFAEALARHYEQGGQWRRAAACYGQAAARAKERYALHSADAYCRQALDCAARSGDAVAESAAAFMLLGDIASLRDEQQRANDWYAQALALPLSAEARGRLEDKRHRLGVARRNGARLTYSETGRGRHTIILLNPLIYSPALLQPIIDEFCHEYRIVTIAPRGSGQSDPMPRPYSWQDRADDVCAVIKALGAGPVTGVGVSRGSNLLLRVAAEHPALIARLVLLGTPVDDAGPESPFPRAREAVRPIQDALAADDLPRAVTEFCRMLFSEPDVEDLVELHIRSILGLPKETVLAFFDPDPEVDVRPFLARIKVPTLVTHGTADRRVDPACGPYIAKRIARGRFYPFEGKGHLAICSAAKEFCRVLRDFLRETGG